MNTTSVPPGLGQSNLELNEADVVFSYRWKNEWLRKRAHQLHDILQGNELKSIFINEDNEDDYYQQFSRCVRSVSLVVVLGDQEYGERLSQSNSDDHSFSTFEELSMIRREKKPMLVIKMCQEFNMMVSDFLFKTVLNVLEWYLDSDMPEGLVPSICAAVSSAKSGHAPVINVAKPLPPVATGEDKSPSTTGQMHSGDVNTLRFSKVFAHSLI
jgi:hypothetical protein